MKIVASIIGPTGVALLGQFTNSTTIISTLGTGCINQGVTKYIAQFQGNDRKQQSIIETGLGVTLLSSIIASILVLVFSTPLGRYIFKSSEYRDVIIFFAVTLIFFSVNMLIVSIINGFKNFRKYIFINIGGSLLALLITIPSVYYFGVKGALVSLILSQTANIFITIFFTRREVWFIHLKRLRGFSKHVVRLLLGFSLMTLVSSLLGPYAQLFIRGHIIERLSIFDAGIWEGINRVSAMYLTLITTSISVYYLPKLSEIKEPSQLRSEIIRTVKIVLPPLAVACIAIFICRDWIIRIVFTQEFLKMRELFAVQLLGDFFKIASWLLAYIFWAKAMTKTFIITEVVFAATSMLFSYFSINRFGFEGTVYGYTLNYFLYFLTVLFILRKLLFYGK